MRAFKPGLDFLDALKVDNGGAVNAHEFCGIELGLHFIQVSTYQVRVAIAMQPQIISLSFDPVQVVGFHKKKAAFVGNGNSFQVFFLTSELLQQLRQFRIRNVRSSQLQAAPGAEQGYMKALLGKGFEQIIQGLGVKCLERVAIVGGDEDSQRHALDADGVNHLEAVHLRHLNIEEHEVGVACEDGLDRLVAVA